VLSSSHIRRPGGFVTLDGRQVRTTGRAQPADREFIGGSRCRGGGNVFAGETNPGGTPGALQQTENRHPRWHLLAAREPGGLSFDDGHSGRPGITEWTGHWRGQYARHRAAPVRQPGGARIGTGARARAIDRCEHATSMAGGLAGSHAKAPAVRLGPFFCEFRSDELMPLICPTCQKVSGRDRSRRPYRR